MPDRTADQSLKARLKAATLPLPDHFFEQPPFPEDEIAPPAIQASVEPVNSTEEPATDPIENPITAIVQTIGAPDREGPADLPDANPPSHSENPAPEEIEDSIAAIADAHPVIETLRPSAAPTTDAEPVSIDTRTVIETAEPAPAATLSDIPAINLPKVIFEFPQHHQEIEGRIKAYDAHASSFRASYGPLADSPWRAANLRATVDQIPTLVALLEDIETSSNELDGHEAWAIAHDLTLDELIAAAARLESTPRPPSLDSIEILLEVAPDDLWRALEQASQIRSIEQTLTGKPRPDLKQVSAAQNMAKRLWDPALATLPAPQIVAIATERQQAADRFLGCFETIEPALSILKVAQDAPSETLLTACVATVSAAAAPKAMRKWLSWNHNGDEVSFIRYKNRGLQLAADAASWSDRLSGYNIESPPDAIAIYGYASAIRAGGSWLKPWTRKAWNSARTAAQALGFNVHEPTCASDLDAFAAHLDMVTVFERNPLHPVVIGKLWNGIRTDFKNMEWAVQSRAIILKNLEAMPMAKEIANVLFSLNEKELGALAAMKSQVSQCYTLLMDDIRDYAGKTLTSAKFAAGIASSQGVAVETADQEKILTNPVAPLNSLLEIANLFERLDRTKADFASIPGHKAILAAVLQPEDAERLAHLSEWIVAVHHAGLPPAAIKLLFTDTGPDKEAALSNLSAAMQANDKYRTRVQDLATMFGIDIAEHPRTVIHESVADLLTYNAQLFDFITLSKERADLEAIDLGAFLDIAEAVEPPQSLAEIFRHALNNQPA